MNDRSAFFDLKEAQLRLTSQLVEIYGPADGLKNSSVLVPAILRDFDGMLSKADVGDNVSETYRTEDGIVEISLEAVKKKGLTELVTKTRRR